jgi:hypothetical protein
MSKNYLQDYSSILKGKKQNAIISVKNSRNDEKGVKIGGSSDIFVSSLNSLSFAILKLTNKLEELQNRFNNNPGYLNITSYSIISADSYSNIIPGSINGREDKIYNIVYQNFYSRNDLYVLNETGSTSTVYIDSILNPLQYSSIIGAAYNNNNLLLTDGIGGPLISFNKTTYTFTGITGTVTIDGVTGRQLQQITDITSDPNGNGVYICHSNGGISLFNPVTMIDTTIAGYGLTGPAVGGSYAVDVAASNNAPALSPLNFPIAISVDSSSSVYVCEYNQIRKISGGRITVVAGTGSGNPLEPRVGPALSANIKPLSVAVVPDGTIYFIDYIDFYSPRELKYIRNGMITKVVIAGLYSNRIASGLSSIKYQNNALYLLNGDITVFRAQLG